MIRLASFDPGEVNFAVAITEHRTHPEMGFQQSRVLFSAMLQHTITNLRDVKILAEQSKNFYSEICDLFDEYWPLDDVIIERFMGRGITVGTTSETTNIMIGIIAHILWQRYEIRFPSLISAAIWKQEYNKLPYSSGLKGDYKLCGTTPHQLDAGLIGHYRAAQLMGLKPFRSFHDEALRDKFMWNLENASKDPLVKRRNQRRYYPTEL